MGVPKNHTHQVDQRSSTSGAGTLTVEQRLARIEKILARMIIRATNSRDREMEMYKARYEISEFSAW